MKKIIIFSSALAPLFFFSQEKERVRDIEEVVFQKKAKKKVTDLSTTVISAKEAQQVSSLSGGVEGLLKTLPSVNSNTELSSQ